MWVIETVGCFTRAIAPALAKPIIVTNVVLYSRLTSLTTVFSFQIAGPSSNRLPSAADPYSLPLLAEHDLGLRVSKSMSFNTHINTRISGMFLRAVKYDSPYGSTPTGKGQLISENGAIFYQLSLLFNNLQLSERLYVEASTDSDELIHAPVVFGRSKIAKTTAKVVNEFIVPDGYVDNELGDLLQDPTNTELSSDNSDVEYSTEDQDPRTIRFEWLGEEINSALLESPNANTVSKVIELVRAEIELRLASGVSSIDTL